MHQRVVCYLQVGPHPRGVAVRTRKPAEREHVANLTKAVVWIIDIACQGESGAVLKERHAHNCTVVSPSVCNVLRTLRCCRLRRERVSNGQGFEKRRAKIALLSVYSQ